MKALLRSAAVLCLFHLLLTPAYTQITFDFAKLSGIIAPGTTETDHSDTVLQSVNIGSPGSTSWDFSDLHNNSTSTISNVSPDSTPFFSLFPTATIARVTVVPGTGTSYSYAALGSTFTALGGVLAGLTNQVIHLSPPEVLVQLPMTYGTQWTTTYTVQGDHSSTQHTDSYSVDAYGPLTFPGGLVSQALRVKVDQLITSGATTTHLITYGIKALNGMSVNIYVADTTQPNNGTINILGMTWNDPINTISKVTVTTPAASQVVLAGAQFTINWTASGIDSVKIDLSLDDGATFTSITNSVPASQNQFLWDVPDTLAAKCRIRVADLSDTSTKSITSRFGIKPYVLTRFDDNGNYERFDPAVHGWQYTNDTTDMWPYQWWHQFNYENGADPFTQQPYPPIFTSPSINAKSSNFVDWPLFVREFDTSQCYQNVPTGTYNALAIRLWSKFPVWDGSCAGFAISSLMAFDDQSLFLVHFPEVGSFTHLYDLPLTNERRAVINLLWSGQLGLHHTQLRAQAQAPLLTTLQKLKDMLQSDQRQDGYLRIVRGDFNHAVVPYQLQRTGTGLYKLRIYDSNYPGTNPAITIDSIGGIWIADSYSFGRNDGLGLDIMEPAADFYLPDSVWNWTSSSATFAKRSGPAAASLRIYTTPGASVTIIDALDDSIGHRDSTTFTSIPGAGPIQLETGHNSPPIGFAVPPGGYSVTMHSIPDSTVTISALEDNQMFTYWQRNVVAGTTEKISLGSGMGTKNSDNGIKTINLESIAEFRSGERQFQLLNIPEAQNDSVRIETPDSTQLKFVNSGGQKTYDLAIGLASHLGAVHFQHSAITVPAHSSDYIIPDWHDLQHQPVKILEDVGNTGTISDSLFVSDQTTGVKESPKPAEPKVFSLEQNYPNPFNPATVISYALPKEAHVTLAVYDLLGQVVATLVDEVEQPGVKSVKFDGSGLPSGLYFYRLNAGGYSKTRKMLLMR
jgi:hypothetical protein